MSVYNPDFSIQLNILKVPKYQSNKNINFDFLLKFIEAVYELELLILNDILLGANDLDELK